MASAGRILIMPKGNYNAATTYEILDLVYHNGASWLAKKTVQGIEPSVSNSEHWQNVFNLNEISLEDLGAVPKESLGQAIYASNLMSDFLVPTLVSWDENTEGTPYKHGLTECTHGFAIVYGSYADFQTIMAWTRGGEPNCFIHCVNGGYVHGWDVFLPQKTLKTYIEETIVKYLNNNS